MVAYLTSLVILAFFGFLIWRVVKTEKDKPETNPIPKDTDGDNGNIPVDVDRLS